VSTIPRIGALSSRVEQDFSEQQMLKGAEAVKPLRLCKIHTVSIWPAYAIHGLVMRLRHRK
jgi:hypothetical protein